MGKGSKRRPMNITSEQFAANWDSIFGVKPELERHDWKQIDHFKYRCMKCEKTVDVVTIHFEENLECPGRNTNKS